MWRVQNSFTSHFGGWGVVHHLWQGPQSHNYDFWVSASPPLGCHKPPFQSRFKHLILTLLHRFNSHIRHSRRCIQGLHGISALLCLLEPTIAAFKCAENFKHMLTLTSANTNTHSFVAPSMSLQLFEMTTTQNYNTLICRNTQNNVKCCTFYIGDINDCVC